MLTNGALAITRRSVLNHLLHPFGSSCAGSSCAAQKFIMMPGAVPPAGPAALSGYGEGRLAPTHATIIRTSTIIVDSTASSVPYRVLA